MWAGSRETEEDIACLHVGTGKEVCAFNCPYCEAREVVVV